MKFSPQRWLVHLGWKDSLRIFMRDLYKRIKFLSYILFLGFYQLFVILETIFCKIFFFSSNEERQPNIISHLHFNSLFFPYSSFYISHFLLTNVLCFFFVISLELHMDLFHIAISFPPENSHSRSIFQHENHLRHKKQHLPFLISFLGFPGDLRLCSCEWNKKNTLLLTRYICLYGVCDNKFKIITWLTLHSAS